MNYEEINSYTFEIKFRDSIELWNTKEITRAEFQQEIFRDQRDSLYAALWLQKGEIEDRDSIGMIWKKGREFLEQAYLRYCDTVTPVFIKYLPVDVVANLLTGVQDTAYDEEAFKSQIQLEEGVSYGNSVMITSYYPLVGMTIYSEHDTLIVYNDGQQELMIPWLDKRKEIQLYNPLINWALDAILPEQYNYNKHRLTTGMTK